MKPLRHIIRNADDFAALIRRLAGRNDVYTVTVTDGEVEDRTLSQNALQFRWASEVSRQRGDMTAGEVQHEFKLDFGVPILREDDPVFNGFCGKVIDPLTRAQQMKAMKWIAISSVMSTKQMSRYMDEIQRFYTTEGFRLTDPEARAYEGMQR